jgi:hypothetical protein
LAIVAVNKIFNFNFFPQIFLLNIHEEKLTSFFLQFLAKLCFFSGQVMLKKNGPELGTSRLNGS